MNAQLICIELKENAQNLMKTGDVSGYLKALLQLLELQKLQSFA